MPSCERCWADSHRDPYADEHAYSRLLKERNGECTPEQQAGPDAAKCSGCGRWAVHQHAHICMACGTDFKEFHLDLDHRWPYGDADYHEPCCVLHALDGRGECDCKASDVSDTEWGAS